MTSNGGCHGFWGAVSANNDKKCLDVEKDLHDWPLLPGMKCHRHVLVFRFNESLMDFSTIQKHKSTIM